MHRESLYSSMREHAMPIDFRTPPTLNFDPTSGQVQTQFTSALFNSRVVRAEAALKSFDIGYTNGDHHVLREVLQTSIASIQNNQVTVRVDYLFRDSSGNIDDPYNGAVDVVVIAEVV
jgi:hypothetical protein